MKKIFFCICLIILFSNISSNKFTTQTSLPQNLIVDFHENMKHNKYYKISVAEKDKNWKLVKALYEEHIVKNPKYSEKSRIPKIIHQIWLGGNGKLPKKYHSLQKTWIDNHPDWEYMLWTEKEIEELGLINKKLFDETDNYGAKSDIARYEILYKIGGLYVDTDFECLRSLEIFNHLCDFYAGIVYNAQTQINNGLIGSIPGHPILKLCIDNLKPKEGDKDDNIPKRTGPWHLTRNFILEVEKWNGPCVAFPVGFFYPWPHYHRHQNRLSQIRKWIKPETYAIHHWHVAWNK